MTKISTRTLCLYGRKNLRLLCLLLGASMVAGCAPHAMQERLEQLEERMDTYEVNNIRVASIEERVTDIEGDLGALHSSLESSKKGSPSVAKKIPTYASKPRVIPTPKEIGARNTTTIPVNASTYPPTSITAPASMSSSASTSARNVISAPTPVSVPTHAPSSKVVSAPVVTPVNRSANTALNAPAQAPASMGMPQPSPSSDPIVNQMIAELASSREVTSHPKGKTQKAQHLPLPIPVPNANTSHPEQSIFSYDQMGQEHVASNAQEGISLDGTRRTVQGNQEQRTQPSVAQPVVAPPPLTQSPVTQSPVYQPSVVQPMLSPQNSQPSVTSSSVSQPLANQPTMGRVVSKTTSKSSVGRDSSSYKSALRLYEQNKFGAAEKAFSQFMTDFPKSSLAPNAMYWYGECFYSRKELTSAILRFKDVVTRYPKHDKAAASLYKLGLCYKRLGDDENASFYWGILRTDFPGSEPERLLRKEYPNQ